MENLSLELILNDRSSTRTPIARKKVLTHHTRVRRRVGQTTAKARSKNDMIDHELSLLSIIFLDCHLPFFSLGILNNRSDGGREPNVKLEDLGVMLQPIRQLQMHLVRRRCGGVDTPFETGYKRAKLKGTEGKAYGRSLKMEETS